MAQITIVKTGVQTCTCSLADGLQVCHATTVLMFSQIILQTVVKILLITVRYRLNVCDSEDYPQD